jgi:nucleoside-diphosphate-sugar epimerase
MRAFPWRAAGLRVLADTALINACVILSFLLWFAFYVLFVPDIDSGRLQSFFRAFYLNNYLMLTFVFLITFCCFGFYTKARRYENRFKLIVVIQAITTALLAYIFLEYFLFRAPLIPRRVAMLIWIMMVVAVMGSRCLKGWVVARFQFVPTRTSKGRKIENVLVIGGAGYIGSVLVRQLMARNYRVRILDNLLYGDVAIRELEGQQNFELLVGDFRNVEDVVRACKDIDAVIHLGAIVGDPACALEPTTTVEINLAATKMVMEICKGYGISRFVFASTCSVYGSSSKLMDEGAETKPVSLYAATKLDSEALILGAACDNFHPTVLRLATAFGHSFRPRFDLIVNLLSIKALAENSITILNGSQWRPFIHIHDAARCFIMVMEAPLKKVAGHIFNAGADGMNFTLGQVAELVRKHIPTVEVAYLVSNDQRNYRVSFKKIRTVVGFECEKSIDEGVLEIKRAYEQKEIADYQNVSYSNQSYLSAAAASKRVAPTVPISSTLEFIRRLPIRGQE